MNQAEAIAYSVNDAARILGIGRTTLYGEIKAKRLPAIKVGRRTLIRRKDAEEWIDSHSEMIEGAA